MEYYESYLDEDLEDALGEDNDELFEDYEEDDGLGEGRAERQQRRSARRNRRFDRKQKRLDRRRGGTGDKKPASTAAVQNAFENVGQDIVKVQKDVKKAEARQSNEQMNDIIASILFRPRLEITNLAVSTVDGKVDKTKVIVRVDKDNNIIDKDGNIAPANTAPEAEVGYKLNDGLLALLAVKFIGNMKGVDTSKGFQQYLPLMAGVALSPSAQKDLGLGNLLGSGTGTSSGDSALSNLTKNPAILLLLLFLFMKK